MRAGELRTPTKQRNKEITQNNLKGSPEALKANMEK
jgi:hypothetical protein